MPGLGDWLQGGPPPEEPGLGDRLLNQWKASLANRVLSAPSKLFGGLVVDPAVEGVTDLVTLAGDVYGGRQPTMSADPQTGEMHTDPRLSERTANAAGNLAGGGLATAGGRAGVGVFGGRLAKTANIEKLTRATDMANGGFTPEEIWKETGWFKGKDDKWRFEIPDRDSRLEEFAREDIAKGNEYPLGGMGGRAGSYGGPAVTHPELFAAYPQLGDVRLHNRVSPGSFGTSFGGNVGIAPHSGPLGARDTLLHELQHEVQRIEGFARGGNPAEYAPGPMFDKKATYLQADLSQELTGGLSHMPSEIIQDIGRADPARVEAIVQKHGFASVDEALAFLKQQDEMRTPMGQYRRLAGEVEARNVETRTEWPPEALRETLPTRTQDVPDEQQIVRFRGLGDRLQGARQQ